MGGRSPVALRGSPLLQEGAAAAVYYGKGAVPQPGPPPQGGGAHETPPRRVSLSLAKRGLDGFQISPESPSPTVLRAWQGGSHRRGWRSGARPPRRSGAALQPGGRAPPGAEEHALKPKRAPRK